MSDALPLPPARPFSEREFEFTEDDFRQLSALAARLAGIHLSEAKRELVYARLARRLRQLRLKSFAQYCRVLDREEPEELEAFVNAITTNHTSFFREPHHFEFLRREVLPAWAKANPVSTGRVLRVWCAGCSTGEEPYTVAMTVRDALPGREVSIVATDLDSNVLETGARGVYPAEKVSDLSESVRKRWFLKGQGRKAGLVRVNPRLQELIEFRQHNMILERPPAGGAFDVIFCRNVVIYFDKATQAIVVDRFRSALRDGAYLMVGHSESLLYRAEGFELVGQSTYRWQA
ncbi:MAG: protein-glutamate O-methyltransferase CheR [Pseudomonadota bacterium]